MQKIINGKMYNTETATCIGFYDNHLMVNNFDYRYEALYRKQTGEFFLYATGGLLTEYASYRGRETILPLAETAAKRWVEDYLNADTYITLFGAPEE